MENFVIIFPVLFRTLRTIHKHFFEVILFEGGGGIQWEKLFLNNLSCSIWLFCEQIFWKKNPITKMSLKENIFALQMPATSPAVQLYIVAHHKSTTRRLLRHWQGGCNRTGTMNSNWIFMEVCYMRAIWLGGLARVSYYHFYTEYSTWIKLSWLGDTREWSCTWIPVNPRILYITLKHQQHPWNVLRACQGVPEL